MQPHFDTELLYADVPPTNISPNISHPSTLLDELLDGHPGLVELEDFEALTR
jgi:hypothetical protein